MGEVTVLLFGETCSGTGEMFHWIAPRLKPTPSRTYGMIYKQCKYNNDVVTVWCLPNKESCKWIQSSHPQLIPQLVAKADAMLFFFDVMNTPSFQALDYYLEQVQELARPNCIQALLINTSRRSRRQSLADKHRGIKKPHGEGVSRVTYSHKKKQKNISKGAISIAEAQKWAMKHKIMTVREFSTASGKKRGQLLVNLFDDIVFETLEMDSSSKTGSSLHCFLQDATMTLTMSRIEYLNGEKLQKQRFLHYILADKEARYYFMAFLTRRGLSKLLMFWLDVETLKRNYKGGTIDCEELKSYIVEMRKKYFVEGGELELGFQMEVLREKLGVLLDRDGDDEEWKLNEIFDSPQRETFKLMNAVFNDFLKSVLFDEMKDTIAQREAFADKGVLTPAKRISCHAGTISNAKSKQRCSRGLSRSRSLMQILRNREAKPSDMISPVDKRHARKRNKERKQRQRERERERKERQSERDVSKRSKNRKQKQKEKEEEEEFSSSD